MFNKHGRYYNIPFQRPMEDLLRDQRHGRFLNFDEKKRIKKEAEENRKNNLQKR